MKLNLTLACKSYDRTLALEDGTVSPEGIDLNVVSIPLAELFRRHARHGEFDVAEFSLSTYTLLCAKGDRRFVGIPVFLSRKFRHADIWVKKDSRIREPKDLVGKRIGTQEYQQTAGVWSRGVLQHEYGVHPSQMEWYCGGYNRPEKYTVRVPVDLPENVRTRQIPDDRCLSDLLEQGELDAVMGGDPLRAYDERSPRVTRLFPNAREVEVEYYHRTGIFPIMHLVAIKREIYEKAPWVAASLFKAFLEAKAIAYRRLWATGALYCMLPWLREHLNEVHDLMGPDPFVYGIDPNRIVLETFLQYGYEQGLLQRPLAVDELFVAEARDFVDSTFTQKLSA